MTKYKTLGLFAIIAICSGMSSAVAAQTAPQNSHVVQVKTVETTPVLPVKMVSRYKTRRIVEPVPLQAEKTNLAVGNVYVRKIYAKNGFENNPTKFIFNGETKNIQTPVYFSKDALKSR